MSEDKRRDTREMGRISGSAADDSKNANTRARNRTVLLSPEHIGQIRATLVSEPESPDDPVSDLMPPMTWDYPESKGGQRSDEGFRPMAKSAVVSDEDRRGTATFKQQTPERSGTSGFGSRAPSFGSGGQAPPPAPPQQAAPTPQRERTQSAVHRLLVPGDEQPRSEHRQAPPSTPPQPPPPPPAPSPPPVETQESRIPEAREHRERVPSSDRLGREDRSATGEFRPGPAGERVQETRVESRDREARVTVEPPPRPEPRQEAQQRVEPRPESRVAEPRSSDRGGIRVVSKSAKGRLVGFLVSFDTDALGEIIELRTGRWLVTSRPTDQGDYILIEDASVSPLHAIVRATGEGLVQVLDQLSELGSGVVRAGALDEEMLAGALATINHGDYVRFGKRHFAVCLLPKVRHA